MSNYIPYPFYYDDAPVDISFVFADEKPAGKHGFLQVKGTEFCFEDGTTARFWGANFNGCGNFPDHKHAENTAKRLAKMLGKGKTVVTVLPDTAERYFSTPLFEGE